MRCEFTVGGRIRTAKSLDEARRYVIPYYTGYLRYHDTQIIGMEIRSEYHQKLGTLLFMKTGDGIEVSWKERCNEYLINRDGTLGEKVR